MIVVIILVSVVLFLIALFVIEPFLLAFVYSQFLKLFVKNPPFADVEKEFPEGKILKDNWPIIRKELEKVLENVENVPLFHNVDGLQKSISARDGKAWRTFIIKGFDAWLPANAALVPETSELIRQIPRVSLAMFSIIDGGKHIPPHYGFFKSVLRYHLAMIIPEGDCYIEVGGERYSWKEGEHVLFDDTYRHEVWNKTEERRVVLFLDVLRDLPGPMDKMNRYLFSILQKSKKLKAAAARAEVARDV
ncbi:aspartyl/asparaginyl beta-hydroxylase domain-containing protein [Spirochaeta isovalerica]|uniref:Beta-hydroxylase n=1 Tax=Spirochaeta isovalerica TaxID=150 RepID=A0A841RCL8_9SPIO|nr:aspartyl/asparaginyl beta-hydroxylase domain-containing protein [Spirochaeta isovalerica]MBB6481735.1 beta-hydroxylase [Spirochaeta isovalerica]